MCKGVTMSILRKRALVDAVVLLVLMGAGWAYFSSIEAFELLAEFVERYEDWELDELVTSLVLIGIAGFVYAVRRYNDARGELDRRKQAEANVQWLAQNDALTELPNRRFLNGFLQCFDDARPSGGETRRHAVFSIDLDGFKQVNDLHGHFAGDALLKTIAQRLAMLMDDDLVVRLGGDEFLVVADLSVGADAARLADQIAEAVTQPVRVEGFQVEVGVSVGYAVYPDQVTSLADGVRCADIAMYAAKQSRVSATMAFDCDMADEAARRLKLESAFRRAVRDDAITPHFQPLIDLESGDVYGFEVLARWTTPDGEVIPPSVFIPLAEQTGLITDMSERLLAKACREATLWPDHLGLSFNLSPTQLSDRLIGLRILTVLKESGLSPHRLEIEVTESAMVQDGDAALEILNGLRAAGIRTALDDFGTGYSSLSQIARFSFDRIKIDRSFIGDFLENEKQNNIVRAIIALSHGLSIRTTAEGVEDATQLEALRALGCDAGQGYLLGRPMKAEDARALVGDGRYGGQDNVEGALRPAAKSA